MDADEKLKPESAEAWREQADILWEQGQLEDAARCFRKALKCEPDDPMESMTWLGLGLVLLEAGKYKAAVKSFDRGLKQPSIMIENWYYRAEALVKLGRYQEAVESYEKTLEIEDFPGALAGKLKALDHLDEWLKTRRPPELHEELFKLVTAIEGRLHLFIRQRLQQVFGQEESGWWIQGIPEKVRIECAQRRERDPRRQPLYDYVYLIDLEDILDKNWKLFEPAFQQIKGTIESKKAFLHRLVRLNEIRNMVMHPTRGVLIGALNQSDLEFTRQMRDLIESFTPSG